MALPCSSQLHPLLISQLCTEGVPGGIQPSSASLLGRAKHAESHFANCLAKTFPKQGKCPQIKEKSKVSPLEKQLDMVRWASWRGERKFQLPSPQSCFCSQEYAFRRELKAYFLSMDRSDGFSCPLQLKRRGSPLLTSSSQDAGGASGSPSVELASWNNLHVSLHLIDSLFHFILSWNWIFYLSSLACDSYFPPHTVSAAI